MQAVNRPIWEPTPTQAAATNISAFMAQVSERYGIDVPDYAALYRFSIEAPEKFWVAAWDFCEIIAETRGDTVVTGLDLMPGADWFSGARLNFAENLLRRRDGADALVLWSEDRIRRRLSYAELYDAVSRVAQALDAEGVGPGDRIAGLFPNVPEAIVAMLAATSRGAIWCACGPEFGVEGILDRFGPVAPKVLFAADGYLYNGKVFDTREKVQQTAAALPSLVRTVVLTHIGGEADIDTGFDADIEDGTDTIPGTVGYDEFIAGHPGPGHKLSAIPVQSAAFYSFLVRHDRGTKAHSSRSGR